MEPRSLPTILMPPHLYTLIYSNSVRHSSIHALMHSSIHPEIRNAAGWGVFYGHTPCMGIPLRNIHLFWHRHISNSNTNIAQRLVCENSAMYNVDLAGAR